MLELDKRRKRVLYAFAAVYAVFLLMLGWVFFLSPSVELMETIGAQKKVFAVNPTEQGLQEVKVFYLQGNEKKLLKEIGLMQPNEKIELDLTQFEGMQEVELVATAKFHNEFRKKIILAGTSFNTKYKVIAPTKIFEGEEFELAVEIENSGNEAMQLNAAESHDNEFLSGTNEKKSLLIPANSSKEAVFSFKALKAGATEILFNIEIGNNTEELTHEIFISEKNELTEETVSETGDLNG